jgi:Kef-type K+ transport system membrane component KefB
MHHLLENPLSRLVAQVLAILVVSRIVHLVFRPLREPLAVAEMLAGILLGPSLLGWLAPDVSSALFPPASLGILHLVGQLGLIFFMFVVGLELDLELLRNHRRSSFLISMGGIATPFILGIVIGYEVYPILSTPDVSRIAFSLFIGVALSITAFPVLARILKELQLHTTELGAITTAAAAVDDVVAWSLLAFVVAIARSSDLSDALVTLSLALAFVIAMFRVVRPLLARLARRNPAPVTQNLIAFATMAALVSSGLTELIGIHALFGAFVLGVVMPREGGVAQAIAARLEDLVLLVWLPVFFASTGLRTEIGLLSSGEEWALCGFIIVAACAGKIGGAGLSTRLLGFSWRESGTIGLLMNTRGLMELVVLSIGLELGILSRLTFSMMVLMAVTTTFMTAPLVHLVGRSRVPAVRPAAASQRDAA